MKDLYPDLRKKDTLPQRIFRILKVKHNQEDFSKGSTFTKQGLSKILWQIEVLLKDNPEVFESLKNFKEPH